MKFPETMIDPEAFYGGKEVKNYLKSSRSVEIQSKLSSRAFDLLSVPDQRKPRVCIDVGCGTGLTQNILILKRNLVFGVDIILEMIKIVSTKKKKGTDFILLDLRNLQKVFRMEKFDYSISISAFQWAKIPKIFFHGKKINNKGLGKKENRIRSVIQFYPRHHEHITGIKCILNKNFGKNFMVLDNPENKKKKKFFLLIENSKT